MYNPLLRYLPMRSLPLLYERLHEYRTQSWQPRLYTSPAGNGGAVLTPGNTNQQQIRTAVSGCDLIGYMLAAFIPGSPTSEVGSVGVVVVDADAQEPGGGTAAYGGYPFVNGINRYLIGNIFTPGSYVGISGWSGQRFVLLNEPYKIAADLLTVKITNLNVNESLQVQLVLYVMEPYSE